MSENTKLYISAMAFARTLLRKELLTDKEYCEIETAFREKYLPNSGTLLSDIDLINLENRGIYDH